MSLGLISRSSRVHCPPSLSSRSQYFCLSVSFGVCGALHTHDGCVSECNEKTQPHHPEQEDAETADVAHECRPDSMSGFPIFFLSFPLSWEHTALWNLSSDVVRFFFARSKHKKENWLCRIFCVSFAFLASDIMQRLVPRELIHYGTSGESLGCFGCVFERQSKRYNPLLSLSAPVPRCLIPVQQRLELGVSSLMPLN